MKHLSWLVKISLIMCSFSAYAKNEDIVFLREARTAFSKGELDRAYQKYEKIPRSSDFWLEATEEKAHVMGRKGDYAKTISLLQTLLVPTFDGVVGPEPYFVAALTYLKICDYTSVLKITAQFKDRFKNRIDALRLLKDKKATSVKALFESSSLEFSSIGSIAKLLPRHFNRDKEIQSLWPERRSLASQKKITDRLAKLAVAELSEVESVISKLHLIEAEVIHRVNLADKFNRDRETQGNYDGQGEVLIFPFDKEIWLDELDSFAAKIEKCPKSPKRASL